jgi:hypothetical protein
LTRRVRKPPKATPPSCSSLLVLMLRGSLTYFWYSWLGRIPTFDSSRQPVLAVPPEPPLLLLPLLVLLRRGPHSART